MRFAPLNGASKEKKVSWHSSAVIVQNHHEPRLGCFSAISYEHYIEQGVIGLPDRLGAHPLHGGELARKRLCMLSSLSRASITKSAGKWRRTL